MHDDDEDEDNEVLEAPHNTSDIEVEYEKSVRFDHNSTSSRYMHGIKDGRFKSHCKKSGESLIRYFYFLQLRFIVENYLILLFHCSFMSSNSTLVIPHMLKSIFSCFLSKC